MRTLKTELGFGGFVLFDLKTSIEPSDEEINEEDCHVCISLDSLRH